ncbi:MAG: diguanylate cyclase [Planctomycetes bacterium]|nr:diguanylate cyclase [Planctomycetota bacterium]
MVLLLIEGDASRAATLEEALRAAGATSVVAPTAEALRRAVEQGAAFDAVALTAGSPEDAVRAARALARPVVLLEDGRPVPPAVLRADPCAVVPVDGAPPALEARLDDALARRADRAAAEVLDAAGAAVLTTDGDGRVRTANRAWARLAGDGRRPVAGALLGALVVPDGDDGARAAFAVACVGGGTFTGDATVVGGPSVRATLAPRPGGVGAVVVLVDLSDRRALEESLREANRILARQAFVDPLTGLFNRGTLRDTLERETARVRRYGGSLAVLMIDLDRFKRVNDQWGHLAGDETLRAVASALRSSLREGDVLVRYGGDEFCALLPSTDLGAAHAAADRVRDAVRAVVVDAGSSLRLGASVGIATTGDLRDEDGAEVLVRLADRASLAAKRHGGDRVFEAGSVEARSVAWGDVAH